MAVDGSGSCFFQRAICEISHRAGVVNLQRGIPVAESLLFGQAVYSTESQLKKQDGSKWDYQLRKDAPPGASGIG